MIAETRILTEDTQTDFKVLPLNLEVIGEAIDKSKKKPDVRGTALKPASLTQSMSVLTTAKTKPLVFIESDQIDSMSKYSDWFDSIYNRERARGDVSKTQTGSIVAEPKSTATKIVAAINLLNSWLEGEEAEQRETLSYIMKALDEDRPSKRKLFP
jgi:hypothetical protein